MENRIVMNEPFISIVIPTYNRGKLLSDCLGSIFNQNYPKDKIEVIVVDDASDNQAQGCLKFSNPEGFKIKFIRLDINSGASAARNMGFKESRGDVIACIDDDCRAEPNWLAEIAATFNMYPQASAVGGSILNPIDSKLAWASHIIEFSSWFPVGRTRRVKNIPTCNIAYKKNDISGVSFPENYKGFVYEDSIFNFKLNKAKKIIIFNPEIKVSHYKCAEGFTKNDYYNNQKRYALGFLNGGYKVFGFSGEVLFKFKFLNLFPFRIFLVFLRCLKSRIYMFKFISNFSLVFKGESLRNWVIFKNGAGLL